MKLKKFFVFLIVLVSLSVPFMYHHLNKRSDDSPTKVVKTMVHVLQSFTNASREAGLEVTVMEPEFLRLVSSQESEDGGEQAVLSHWLRHQPNLLTFGVVEPSQDALIELAEAMETKTFLSHHVVEGDDFRGVSMKFFENNLTLSRIPFHYVWYRNDDADRSPVLHLLIFRHRAGHLWHGRLPVHFMADNMDKDNNALTLPFNVFALTMGQHARMIDRFTTETLKVGGVTLSYPAEAPVFLRGYQDGKFVECEYVTAKRMYHERHKNFTDPGEFGQGVQNVMNVTAKILDGLGIPFWLSCGTMLGWYRQCDVIPYAGDSDIEINIKNYFDTFIPTVTKAGLFPIQKLGKVSDSLMISFDDGHEKVDMFFAYEKEDYVWTGAFDIDTFEKYQERYRKYSLSWADFRGVRVRVPDPPEQYLEDLYGRQWRQPTEDFDYLLGPFNKVYVGNWTDEEKNEVIKFLDE